MCLSRAMLRKLFCQKREKWPMDAWVDQYSEAAIDPSMEIIDAHHHLWDPTSHPKGWPVSLWQIKLYYLLCSPEKITEVTKADQIARGNVNILKSFGQRQLPFMQAYMGEDLLLDIHNRESGKPGHNVVKTVYIECGWDDHGVKEALKPVGEAAMVEREHKRFPSICHATVAFADLRLPDVELTLQAYAKIQSVKGIRHSLAYSDDPAIAGSDKAKSDTAWEPAFRRGFALLEKYGYSYDVWMFHEQLEGVADLARNFPGTTIIVDHVAEPLGIGSYKRQETFPKWEKGIREVALASENVYVKLSGLAMCRTGFGFDERPEPPSSQELAQAWAPYIRVCIEAFGVDRCLFASNFPVDKISCDYTVLWNAYKRIVAHRSPEDRRKLFYENAKRVYRL